VRDRNLVGGFATGTMEGQSHEEAFWAREHAMSQKSGWADNGAPPLVENQEVFQLTQKTKLCFISLYMGNIKGVQRAADEIINNIDAEKRSGNIAWSVTEEAKRQLVLTRYGIKVTDMGNLEVFLRIPMHHICSAIRYEEDTNENMVVLETDDGTGKQFSYYVFQMPDQVSDMPGTNAQQFCAAINSAFDAVNSKAQLESASY